MNKPINYTTELNKLENRKKKIENDKIKSLKKYDEMLLEINKKIKVYKEIVNLQNKTQEAINKKLENLVK